MGRTGSSTARCRCAPGNRHRTAGLVRRECARSRCHADRPCFLPGSPRLFRSRRRGHTREGRKRSDRDDREGLGEAGKAAAARARMGAAPAGRAGSRGGCDAGGGTRSRCMNGRETDVLVLGSGIAGLTYALKAAAHGTVAIVTKKERAASSTNYAQGGIAAVMAPEDEPALHVRDTLVAGAGLCHTEAVLALVAEGPDRVHDLIDWGVRFSRSGDDFSFGREGGHSRRRILHA